MQRGRGFHKCPLHSGPTPLGLEDSEALVSAACAERIRRLLNTSNSDLSIILTRTSTPTGESSQSPEYLLGTACPKGCCIYTPKEKVWDSYVSTKAPRRLTCRACHAPTIHRARLYYYKYLLVLVPRHARRPARYLYLYLIEGRFPPAAARATPTIVLDGYP